ncbi:kinase-like domain-containing protein [Daldinia caldariorum]|uniref:kinase-like domain-containing protein n=1 Tax=Daldinia caldariorum TaxID=326644 RepID=UPI0020079119|nr:kinase-like domain-containing protein [Daldinia caldariorum]KAI1463202.1 kinase-like domain-containing protein [Daldinia caldariorum]
MSRPNRHTLFVDDDALLSGNNVPEQRVLPRGTLLLPHQTSQPRASGDKPPRPQSRFPVKRVSEEGGRLVPVISGSPWNHYENRYRVRHGSSFGIITSRREPCRQSMIRTISGRNADEQIQNIRQLCHENIVRSIEIYACSDAGYFLISEFMPTSLMHLCRAPIYPNEPQLSSILHQVLSGVEFLLANGFVHEQLSCANILVNFDGDVKICDVERCTGSGDTSKLMDSFCRVMMRLMDKEKNTAGVVGLTRPGDWSQEAVDLFTLTTIRPSVKQLLSHEFMGRKDKQELVWLIPLVLITAHHNRE